MQFIDNISEAPRMWSVRLAGVAAALGGMETFLPVLEGVVPDGVLGVLAIAAAAGAAVSRVIKQRNLTR